MVGLSEGRNVSHKEIKQIKHDERSVLECKHDELCKTSVDSILYIKEIKVYVKPKIDLLIFIFEEMHLINLI